MQGWRLSGFACRFVNCYLNRLTCIGWWWKGWVCKVDTQPPPPQHTCTAAKQWRWWDALCAMTSCFTASSFLTKKTTETCPCMQVLSLKIYLFKKYTLKKGNYQNKCIEIVLLLLLLFCSCKDVVNWLGKLKCGQAVLLYFQLERECVQSSSNIRDVDTNGDITSFMKMLTLKEGEDVRAAT